jgi:hypothetical protein
MTVLLKNLIVCSVQRRGSGKDLHSPVRILDQVYTPEGDLVAEHDPCGDITPESLLDFLKWHYESIDTNTHIDNIYKYFIEKGPD